MIRALNLTEAREWFGGSCHPETLAVQPGTCLPGNSSHIQHQHPSLFNSPGCWSALFSASKPLKCIRLSFFKCHLVMSWYASGEQHCDCAVSGAQHSHAVDTCARVERAPLSVLFSQTPECSDGGCGDGFVLRVSIGCPHRPCRGTRKSEGKLSDIQKAAG